MTDFPFYAIYEERGFPNDIDGFFGLTTKASEEPSILKTLAKSGVIRHSVVGVHITGDRGDLTLGGYDCDYL